MSIGRNIKQLREEHQLTLKQLAEIAGVTDKAVSLWEKDVRDPRMGAVQRMANYFGITNSKILDEPSSVRPLLYNSMTVPVVRRIPGVGPVVISEEVEAYEILPAGSLPAGEYICFKITGDSMAPKIDHNDRVMVRLQSTVENGAYAVVSVDRADGAVRRVLYDKQRIELVCDNPYYPKQIFTGDDMKRIRIIGQIKRIQRDL